MMQELLSAARLPKLSLRRVVEDIREVSSLPQVALRVMKVANDPDSAAADLKEAMEGDAALSARVLRCVNSSAYAARTPITNLQQAIAYLGVKQIRNLASAQIKDLHIDHRLPRQVESDEGGRVEGIWAGTLDRKLPDFRGLFLSRYGTN